MDFDMLDIKNLAQVFDPEQPTGDPFIDTRYENHRAKFGHGKPYWRLFYHLCQRYRPGLCVELGGWQGTCASHMVAGSQDTVVTIDHHGDPGDDINQALCEDAARHYHPHLVYLKGWTWDVVDQVAALGKPIDVLFIDGWHHYDKAMRDWNDYRDLLADKALVVCDDLENVEPTLHKMVEFWEDVSRGYERFVVTGISTYPMGFFQYER